jgi:lysophospholipase L1-like esterase
MRHSTALLKTTFLFVGLLVFQTSFAKFQKDIELDSATKVLVAPEGQYYQWYLNGERILGANQQTVEVKAAGTYGVEIVDEVGAVHTQQAAVAITATGAVVKVYIIGDSTVCNYAASAYPWMGWGQQIPFFFNKANVTFSNQAIGGRSSRSFYKQGRWTPIKTALKAGDFVFIQWGHNDRDFSDTSRYTDTSDYKKYLTIYVNDTRAAGAFPVLISPMVMNAWKGTTMRNVFTEGTNDYRGAMLAVATKLKVPFVDLNMKSWNLYKGLGLNYITRFIYHTYPAGEYPNYPTGNTDGTHFQISGAIENARMIVQGLTELTTDANIKASLVANLLPTYQISAASDLKGADSMITRTNTYPPGIEVTLKVIPKAKSTFISWNDASNVSKTTDNKYIFTMGTAIANFIAHFKGGVVTGIEESSTLESAVVCYPNPFLESFQVKSPTAFDYQIFNMEGVEVAKGIGQENTSLGAQLPRGMYVLKIATSEGTKTLKVTKN